MYCQKIFGSMKMSFFKRDLMIPYITKETEPNGKVTLKEYDEIGNLINHSIENTGENEGFIYDESNLK